MCLSIYINCFVRLRKISLTQHTRVGATKKAEKPALDLCLTSAHLTK